MTVIHFTFFSLLLTDEGRCIEDLKRLLEAPCV